LDLSLESGHFLALFETVVHLVKNILIGIKRMSGCTILAIGVEPFKRAYASHLKQVEVVLACVKALSGLTSRLNLFINPSHAR
jgi:hypothetical protein